MKTTKLTFLALLTTAALVLSYIDSLLPPPIPVPGIKLGLSNLVILFSLLHCTKKEVLCILFAKIILSSFFAGQVFSFLYSFSGGIMSFFIMCIFLKLFQSHFLPFTSIAGALAHNLTQFIIALITTYTIGLISYLPLLILSAIITGSFIGFCCFFLNKSLSPYLKTN